MNINISMIHLLTGEVTEMSDVQFVGVDNGNMTIVHMDEHYHAHKNKFNLGTFGVREISIPAPRHISGMEAEILEAFGVASFN